MRALIVLVMCSCVGAVTEPEPLPGAKPDPVKPVDAGPLAVPDSGAPADSGTPVADAGPGLDAGVPDAGAPDAGSGRIPIFLAQGKLGRTMISCDDGRTWRANRSEKPNARCWDTAAAENIECDHNAWSSVGLVEADGHFLATYGWGYPGVVRSTEDGVTWTDVLPGHTFAGMASGNGKVMANDHAPWVSSSAGAAGTWTKRTDISTTGWTVRRIGFIPPNRFLITLDGEITYTDDDGATWKVPATRPAACAVGTSDIVTGNGVTLIVQSNGSVCRSTDRGNTWTHVPITGAFSSSAVFSGGAFFVWTGATRHRSTDGLTWTSTTGAPADVEIGPVAVSFDGTFVATRGGWQVWYEKQRFYRSTDGLTWQVLPAGAFVASHPITSFVFGYAKPSAECPQ